MDSPKLITFRLADPLIDGLVKAAESFKDLSQNSQDVTKLRTEVIEHLHKFMESGAKSRLQFVTKHREKLIQALQDLGIQTTINPSIKATGRCASCNDMLPIFDNQTVTRINQSIGAQILSGSDKGLWLNTSPDDSYKFQNFLKSIYEIDRRPIDCVIDGLNIGYKSAQSSYVHTITLSQDVQRTYLVPKPEIQAQVLINTIIRGNMLKFFRKILVVGRTHMIKWPGLIEFFKKNGIYFYASSNTSKDDLFQLFAATLNPRTVLVTNDFLRDHLATLNEKDRDALQRWIETHQAWICNKSLKPIWPTPYEKIPSSNPEKDHIHIPVIDRSYLETMTHQEPPPHLNNKCLTWLCCKIKPLKASALEPDSNDKTEECV